jgi:hypothetical protein
MKKGIFASLVVLAILLCAAPVFSAGSCTQTLEAVPGEQSGVKLLKFACTGDASDGSIPNTDISAANTGLIKGWYLYTVTAYPTSGGTAPDAADVQILMSGLDLLGGKGVNLIHATATKDTWPYSATMSEYRAPVIVNTVTLSVANQATVSANFTIELLFVKW